MEERAKDYARRGMNPADPETDRSIRDLARRTAEAKPAPRLREVKRGQRLAQGDHVEVNGVHYTVESVRRRRVVLRAHS